MTEAVFEKSPTAGGNAAMLRQVGLCLDSVRDVAGRDAEIGALFAVAEGHRDAYLADRNKGQLAAAARTVLTLCASLEHRITSEQSEALEALLMLGMETAPDIGS